MIRLHRYPSRLQLEGLSGTNLARVQRELTYRNTAQAQLVQRMRKGIAGRIWAKINREGLSPDEASYAVAEEIEQAKQKITVCLLWDRTTHHECPAGLFDIVVGALHGEAINLEIVDHRERVDPDVLLPWPVQTERDQLRPYQSKQVETLLDATCGTVEAATATGKSVTIRELVRRIGQDSLIMVPSQQLMWQMGEQIKKYFGPNRVGFYGDGRKQVKPITVAIVDSVAGADPAEFARFRVVIMDETHHSSCDTIQKIMYEVVPEARWRYGFTATPYRSDGADLAMTGASFPVVTQYSIHDGIRDGWLARPRFIMLEVPRTSSSYTGSDPLKCYQHHIMRNEWFQEHLRRRIDTVVGQGKTVLTLVREKTHGHIIHGWRPESVFLRAKEIASERKHIEADVGHLAPWIDPSEGVDRFNRGEIDHLIGTSVIGEGTDTVPVEVLNLVTGGASRNVLMQQIGRGLRTGSREPFGGKKEVIVIDYIFGCSGPLLRHSNIRRKLYEGIGPVTVMRVDG